MRPDSRARTFRATGLLAALRALSLLLASSTAVGAAVFSGFDADLEYWRSNGMGPFAWYPLVGNPPGCLHLYQDPNASSRFAVAPSAYLGDWRSMTASDSISCDVRLLGTGTISPPPYLFRIAGPGGAATALAGFVPPSGVWTHASVALDPAAWQMEAGTWNGLLAHVNSLRIECTNFVLARPVDLDNVRLTGAVAPVTRPCEIETFYDPGLGEWSFAGADVVDNPGSGGNRFGYCYLSNQAGLAWAFAPGSCLGDWSALAAGSVLTFDLRVLYANGVRFTSIPEFVRLRGPGGAATAAIAPSELPAPGRLWKTLRIPLEAPAWTVTSGTWEGLVADVEECSIQLEYYGGDEAIGFDNFGRMSPACPAIDDPLTVQPGDVALTGWTGFMGIASVAFDSTTGFLAGTIDEAAANGGGLYAVRGPKAGTILQAYESPVHVIFDEIGAAYVSEDNAGVVNRLSPYGGTTVWVSGFQSGDDDPSGMCFAPPGFDGPNVDPGDVLVVDWGYGSPDGVWSFKTGLPEGERLLLPDPGTVDMHDISQGPFGYVWLANALDGSKLLYLAQNGQLGEFMLPQPRLGIVSLVYDPVRLRLYVADTDTRSLSYVPFGVQPAVVTVATGFDFFATCCLEIDAPGRRLWVTDVGAGRVYEFRLDADLGVDDRGPSAGGPGLQSLRAWPNPARTATSVQLVLARGADVRVDVLDTAGRLIRRLADQRLEAGAAAFTWDGRDARGLAVPPGVYLVSARAGEDVRATRVVVLR